jgi:transposase-like protein
MCIEPASIALTVRCYLRRRFNHAEVAEWLAERGILVDQTTIYRCVRRYLPFFGDAARQSADWDESRFWHT